MRRIFGPVLTIYVYEDDRFEETLELCDTSSPYALTGAVFAKDRKVLVHVENRLRHAAGNFYLNDKPTGAVVGQQPFGGSRASGTNDKAGSLLNMIRWTSPRVIKETFVPFTTLRTLTWLRNRISGHFFSRSLEKAIKRVRYRENIE